jgi:hypothetical protein
LQRRRLGGDHGALFLDLGKAAAHFGEALRGVARARLPSGHVGGLGDHAFARHGQHLVLRGERRRSVLMRARAA